MENNKIKNEMENTKNNRDGFDNFTEEEIKEYLDKMYDYEFQKMYEEGHLIESFYSNQSETNYLDK